MSNIKFVSHEQFPDDPYTKEMVYLCLEEKYRIAYFRKQSKNGGMFWASGTTSITKDGTKVFFENFLQDSNFLEKDIKAFLDNRTWEKRATGHTALPQQEDLPF